MVSRALRDAREKKAAGRECCDLSRFKIRPGRCISFYRRDVRSVRLKPANVIGSLVVRFSPPAQNIYLTISWCEVVKATSRGLRDRTQSNVGSDLPILAYQRNAWLQPRSRKADIYRSVRATLHGKLDRETIDSVSRHGYFFDRSKGFGKPAHVRRNSQRRHRVIRLSRTVHCALVDDFGRPFSFVSPSETSRTLSRQSGTLRRL
jgi:hypothetical protein